MRWRSLRTQLLLMGLLVTLTPLLVLVLVVFGVEEDETIDSDLGAIDVSAESGVSPVIPLAAIVLAIAAIGVVWLWAKRAIEPIERMTAMTDEIQDGSLDRRLDLGAAPEEIRLLGDSFDRMLDRLANASALERRLIEDASHELRTPLAALSVRLDLVGRRVNGAEIAKDVAMCEDEVQRLEQTLEALLSSARMRQSDVEQVDNDLVVIVERVVDRQRLLTPEIPIDVSAPRSVRLGVDGASIERAVANLVTNAVEHGDSPIRVEVRELGDSVDIEVTDHGPGIAPERIGMIFDRYAGDHNGLGLALVQQVADVYGSVRAVSPVADERGTSVTLRLRRGPGTECRVPE